MSSPFAEIIARAVADSPRAVGGAFAAWDGEVVDFVCSWDEHDWLILTAHYGVVLAHVQAALHTFHFGEAVNICLTHEQLDIIVEAVSEGYFAILALEKPNNLGKALRALHRAADDLRMEMG